MIENITDLVFKRGFFVSFEEKSLLVEKISHSSYSNQFFNLKYMHFFGAHVWCDSLLKPACVMSEDYGVAVFGLTLNPFRKISSNFEIATDLLKSLMQGKGNFYDYLDQLSGSFLILYKNKDGVFLLQDAVATKPIYYHISESALVTASTHCKLIADIYTLNSNSRASDVRANSDYASDPSKYLPGLITPFDEILPLTANTELLLTTGVVSRFFPREALTERDFSEELVDEIAQIFINQAELIYGLNRPVVLAATGGKDSRTSASFFEKSPNLSYFSFSMPSSGHLLDDVVIAKKLSEAKNIPISTYSLEEYSNPNFADVFNYRSPFGIWPAAALCYVNEFPDDAIHIRSTISEIGRCFYPVATWGDVHPETLAGTYTLTEYKKNADLVLCMKDFIDLVDFKSTRFFNYSPYDLFYWEHRNSKWQNVLCHEAEMATDVFIPFNNRNLLKLFLSVPFEVRRAAKLHLALIAKYGADFSSVEYC